MTLYEYNGLDELEQSQALWEHGTHISERDDEKFRYVLYSLFSFYVELKYNRELNVINGSRSFRNTDQLEAYFPNIDISSLTNGDTKS